MAEKDFKGPVTNDKTAVFIKTTGVTESSNLIKSLNDAADAAARWTAVKTWAGADDASVIRLPGAVTDMPAFIAPPNRLNVETYDGDNQTIQVLGIGQTPELDLTVSLFNPGGNDDHATLAALADGTLLDVLVLTATSWKLENTRYINQSTGDSALEAGGTAVLVSAGKPYPPGGAAGDYSRLTIPMAFKGAAASRVVASY